MRLNSRFGLILSFIITVIMVAACSDESGQQKMIYKAAVMESSDECHLCGMLITRFNGPKGEIFRKGQGANVVKFCSTRDMFSYYLDPENKRNVAKMLVHDMSEMPWSAINDEYFIDAKNAWYVIGSKKIGAMGKTLASFGKQSDAEYFSEKFGGKVIKFEEIGLDELM